MGCKILGKDVSVACSECDGRGCINKVVPIERIMFREERIGIDAPKVEQLTCTRCGGRGDVLTLHGQNLLNSEEFEGFIERFTRIGDYRVRANWCISVLSDILNVFGGEDPRNISRAGRLKMIQEMVDIAKDALRRLRP